MAHRESSRKRLKISSTQSVATNSKMPAMPSSSKPAPVTTPANNLSSNPHEQALKILHTDIDAMRQLVTCKICDRLLYEPYALSCGHTYCYSCLSQWLVDNRKKTCPDCRAVVIQQPTPSYIVRELVLIFIGRSQLLPDGETSEEHHNLAREEGKIVANDRANTHPRNGGLFKGCFAHGRRPIAPIYDPGDGVDRCPECHWELEGGFCGQCGRSVDGFDEFDGLGFSDYDDDTDRDAMSDIFDAVYGADDHDDYHGIHEIVNRDYARQAEAAFRAERIAPRGGPSHIDLLSEVSSDDESEDDADLDSRGNLRSFVVADDSAGGADDTDGGEDTDVPRPVRNRSLGRRRAPVVISDDEDEEDSGNDSEDEQPVLAGSQRRKRGPARAMRHPQVVITSDSESDDSGASDDDEADEVQHISHRGFSPLQESAVNAYNMRSDCESDQASSVHPYQEEDDDEEDEDDGDDSESEASDSEDGWGPLSPTSAAGRPILTGYAGTETPHGPRLAPLNVNHRLDTLGQRSNRHSNTPSNSNNFSQGSLTARTGHLYAENPSYYYQSASQNRGRRSFASTARSTPLPPHPFNLDDTLARTNYNMRNQLTRNSYNQASFDGGVGVGAHGQVSGRSTSSGSSSSTMQSEAGPRRKRALSIASDESY